MFAAVEIRKKNAGIFALAALAGILILFAFYSPWKSAGGDLISDGSFETAESTEQWTGWSERAERLAGAGYKNSTGIKLTASPGKRGDLYITVTNLAGCDAFIAIARARTEGEMIIDDSGWRLPRGIFFYRTAAGRGIWSENHTFFRLDKPVRWKKYSEVFPVVRDTVDARLHLQNLAPGGVLYVDDVSLIPAHRRTSATPVFTGALLLWAAAFIYALRACAPWKKRGGMLMTAIALLIVLGSAVPGRVLDRGIHVVASFVQHPAEVVTPAKMPSKDAHGDRASPAASAVLKPPPPEKTPLKSQTLYGNRIVGTVHLHGHFILFTLLAAVSAFSWRTLLPVAGGLLIFSAAVETLQLMIPDRGASLSDFWINIAGCSAGLILYTGALLTYLFIRSIFRAVNFSRAKIAK
ncbi:MAG: VanZ family protein [Kiritimatiellales bacterium]